MYRVFGVYAYAESTGESYCLPAGAMNAYLGATININGNGSFVNNEAKESGGKNPSKLRCFHAEFSVTLLTKLHMHTFMNIFCCVVVSSHVRSLLGSIHDLRIIVPIFSLKRLSLQNEHRDISCLQILYDLGFGQALRGRYTRRGS